NLHKHIAALCQELFDGLVLAAAVTELMDIRHMQKGSTFEADIDKCRLHARQYTADTSVINIAYDPPAAGTFDVQFLRDPLLDDRNPYFLRRDIDKDFVTHGENRSRP